jgi:hypothetical protein
VVTDAEVARLAAAASRLPAATASALEDDFLTNLFVTVLDYMLRTSTVLAALEHFRRNRRDEVRTIDDLDRVLASFPADQVGDTALAIHLWGYRLWTRAGQLRDLVRFFRDVGVVDAATLQAWAHASEFERDFAGRVKGLGRAVYQSLLMRQGIDTVKPDVHLRRFGEAAVGRPLGDSDLIELTTRAARRLGVPAADLDYRIWESSAAPARAGDAPPLTELNVP